MTLDEFRAGGWVVGRDGRAVQGGPRDGPARPAAPRRPPPRSLTERLCALFERRPLPRGPGLEEEERLQVAVVRLLERWTIEGRLVAYWTATQHELRLAAGSLGRGAWYVPWLVAKRRHMGAVKGSPDLVFLWRGGAGGIELKKPSQRELVPVAGGLRDRAAGRGELHAEQRTVRDWCLSLEVPYQVCRTAGQVEEVLSSWGVLLPPSPPIRGA